MRTFTGLNLLLGLFLTGSSVVADDVILTSGQTAHASLTRRGSSASSLTASATEAASATTAKSDSASPSQLLPPLPPGVTELQFGDFFRHPIGPRGLELTETLRGLEGKRVRLVGFMVREHESSRSGVFLLAPRPVTLDEEEFGLCDDLPVSAVLVQVPHRAGEIIPYQSGRIIVTGTLSVGAREEANGRVFLARLMLDEGVLPK